MKTKRTDEEELAFDLRVYGSCYWKYVDGRKVRVPIEEVRYINGEAMEVGGDVVSSAVRSAVNPDSETNK